MSQKLSIGHNSNNFFPQIRLLGRRNCKLCPVLKFLLNNFTRLWQPSLNTVALSLAYSVQLLWARVGNIGSAREYFESVDVTLV